MSFAKGKTITINFDPADVRPGRYSARIEIDGIPFEDINRAETPEAARMEGTIRSTAQSNGFYFVRGFPDPIRRFLTTAGNETADPRKLVDSFRDQGFTVRAEGAYRAGMVVSSAYIAGETPQAFATSQIAETRHIAERKRERDGRQAEAIQRLQTAARAEDMRLEVVFDYRDGHGDKFWLKRGGVAFDAFVAAKDDEDAQAFVKDIKYIAKRNGVFVFDTEAGKRRNGVEEGLFVSTMTSDQNAAGRFVAALSRYARELGGSLRAAGAYDPERGRSIPKPGAAQTWEPDEGAEWQKPTRDEIAATRDRQAEARRSRTTGSNAPAFA